MIIISTQLPGTQANLRHSWLATIEMLEHPFVNTSLKSDKNVFWMVCDILKLQIGCFIDTLFVISCNKIVVCIHIVKWSVENNHLLLYIKRSYWLYDYLFFYIAKGIINAKLDKLIEQQLHQKFSLHLNSWDPFAFFGCSCICFVWVNSIYFEIAIFAQQARLLHNSISRVKTGTEILLSVVTTTRGKNSGYANSKTNKRKDNITVKRSPALGRVRKLTLVKVVWRKSI